jgi:large subunit ribosomal protein L24
MIKNKNAKKPKSFHVKVGDTVMIITGKDKGKTGVIKATLSGSHQVLIEGMNIKRKSVKPNPQFGINGGIVEIEAPIDASNVMLFSHHASKPTRIRHAVITEGDRSQKKRLCIHTQKVLD